MTPAATPDSGISGIANAPVTHMPITPILALDWSVLRYPASARNQLQMGADVLLPKCANSRLMQSPKKLSFIDSLSECTAEMRQVDAKARLLQPSGEGERRRGQPRQLVHHDDRGTLPGDVDVVSNPVVAESEAVVAVQLAQNVRTVGMQLGFRRALRSRGLRIHRVGHYRADHFDMELAPRRCVHADRPLIERPSIRP